MPTPKNFQGCPPRCFGSLTPLISMAIASVRPADNRSMALEKRAVEALDAAEAAGRNQVLPEPE